MAYPAIGLHDKLTGRAAETPMRFKAWILRYQVPSKGGQSGFQFPTLRSLSQWALLLRRGSNCLPSLDGFHPSWASSVY